MIVDSSALLAVVLHEPQAERIQLELARAGHPTIAAPTWFETSMVLRSARIGFDTARITRLREAWNLDIIPLDERHSLAAGDAWQRYGKGNHPARLNFGDCLAYAAAKVEGEPLLYVGEDFRQTDIESVI